MQWKSKKGFTTPYLVNELTISPFNHHIVNLSPIVNGNQLLHIVILLLPHNKINTQGITVSKYKTIWAGQLRHAQVAPWIPMEHWGSRQLFSGLVACSCCIKTNYNPQGQRQLDATWASWLLGPQRFNLVEGRRWNAHNYNHFGWSGQFLEELRVSPCDITMSVVQRCPVNIGAAIAHHTRTSCARHYFFEFWNFYLRCRHGESATGWKWKLSIFLNHCIFFLTVFVFFVGRIHPGQYCILYSCSNILIIVFHASVQICFMCAYLNEWIKTKIHK